MAGIELLYFLVMIAIFVLCLLWLKVPAGISLIISAIIGGLISGFGIPIRHLVEGSFGYIDTILVIVAAMIFMRILEISGALDASSVLIVEKLHKKPTLLLISFMFIIMFPSMITGSALASIVSSGSLVAPIMIAMGIPKHKTAAIIGLGAIFGMIAPPINVPVMVICDVVDMPYIGFELPLLLLSFPLAIFSVLYLGRKHVNDIDIEKLKAHMNFKIKEEVSTAVFIPILVLVVLIVAQNVFARYMIPLGLPLSFMIAALVGLVCGKKVNFLTASKEGVEKSLTAMVLLMGVGMFVQIVTLNGVRGFFVINALSLPDVLLYLSIAITMPIFGGVSAYGSASILGGPFVMALGTLNPVIVASALSLLAGIGEFLPPTAMSATFASKVVGDVKYKTVVKTALVPLITMLIYGMIFVVFIAKVWN